MQLGDFGREGNSNQRSVAEAMTLHAQSQQPSFVISTGDNFVSPAVRVVCLISWTTRRRRDVIICCEYTVTFGCLQIVHHALRTPAPKIWAGVSDHITILHSCVSHVLRLEPIY